MSQTARTIGLAVCVLLAALAALFAAVAVWSGEWDTLLADVVTLLAALSAAVLLTGERTARS